MYHIVRLTKRFYRMMNPTTSANPAADSVTETEIVTGDAELVDLNTGLGVSPDLRRAPIVVTPACDMGGSAVATSKVIDRK